MKLNHLLSTKFVHLFDLDGWTFASRRKDQSMGPYHPDAVSICGTIATPQGRKLVLIREYRKPLRDWEIGFPAGLIDAEETAEDTAKREFLEETGLAFTPSGITPRLASSPGITDEIVPIVFGTAAGTPSITPGICGERIEVLLVGQTALIELLKKDYFFSARSWAILHSLAITGKFADLLTIDP